MNDCIVNTKPTRSAHQMLTLNMNTMGGPGVCLLRKFSKNRCSEINSEPVCLISIHWFGWENIPISPPPVSNPCHCRNSRNRIINDITSVVQLHAVFAQCWFPPQVGTPVTPLPYLAINAHSLGMRPSAAVAVVWVYIYSDLAQSLGYANRSRVC